jgi:RNA polymerase sigma-70 factor, ECF subfamily
VPDERQSLSDVALMRLTQAEDTAAFSALVERYQAALFRVARSRTGRTETAEELVQETLLAAYRSRRTFDPRFSFRTWLWTILLNHCKAHAIKLQRRPPTEPFDAASTASASGNSAPSEGPFAAAWRKERAALLDELLDRLPASQADALRLRFFAELKFQEIADTIGCSLLTAKNRVRAGLLKLAEFAPHELADHSERPTSETSSTAESSAE